MVAPRHSLTPVDLSALRAELVDLAYDLEMKRRFDAADIALALEGRLRELAEAAESPRPCAPAPLYSRFS